MTTTAQIPPGAEQYAQSPLFTEVTVPRKLTTKHNTKVGVWGEICVLSGSLKYIVADAAIDPVILTQERRGIIVPEQDHYVEIIGPVEFQIGFYRTGTERS